MSFHQYRKSHCGDKTVVRSSYLHNGISHTGEMSSLYWIRALVVIFALDNCVTIALNNGFALTWILCVIAQTTGTLSSVHHPWNNTRYPIEILSQLAWFIHENDFEGVLSMNTHYYLIADELKTLVSEAGIKYNMPIAVLIQWPCLSSSKSNNRWHRWVTWCNVQTLVHAVCSNRWLPVVKEMVATVIFENGFCVVTIISIVYGTR